MVKTEQNMKG